EQARRAALAQKVPRRIGRAARWRRLGGGAPEDGAGPRNRRPALGRGRPQLRAHARAPGVRFLPRRPEEVRRAGLPLEQHLPRVGQPPAQDRVREFRAHPRARGHPRRYPHQRDREPRRRAGARSDLQLPDDRLHQRGEVRLRGAAPGEHGGLGLRWGDSPHRGGRAADGGGDDRHGGGAPRLLPEPPQRRRAVPFGLRRGGRASRDLPDGGRGVHRLCPYAIRSLREPRRPVRQTAQHPDAV
ncbi:MAG: hypothetical protein AVDCRST_MAG01-01-2042, partial [uncultured Rubrobacteraceae bacterium]